MDINTLSGIEFEDLTHQLLLNVGFSVEQTKASRDGGIDLIAYSNEPFFKGKYIIQCKRYVGTVGEPIIRDLYGVVSNERANKGVLITTGIFSNSALEFAKDKNLELIDGVNLSSLLNKYLPEFNVGIHYFMDDPAFNKEQYLFLKKKFISEYKELSQKAKSGKQPFERIFFRKIFFDDKIILPQLVLILRRSSKNIQWLLNGLLEEILEIVKIIPYNYKREEIIPYKYYPEDCKTYGMKKIIDHPTEFWTASYKDKERFINTSMPSWIFTKEDEFFEESLLYALNNQFLYCIQELKDIRYVVQILYYTGLYTDFDKKILDKYCQTDMLNDWLSVKDIEPHVKVDNLDEIIQELNWFIKNNEL